ncbi:MAG: cation:proton antiporter, partial [Rubricoccaceae bacterium]|nr:cation:proton antiporter [Rubricoccaceae bacterium]
IGALLTVTGPTVIIPLLRHVRPSGRVGTIAKWEGITIDPIGAILAVLVLESVLLIYEPGTAGHPAEGTSGVIGALVRAIMLEAAVGVGMSFLGALFLVLILRRGLAPDWLQNPLALMTVVAVFAVSNSLQEESGLLSTTLLGIMMANQKFVSVHKIIEFKEDLRVLLISILFIILSARLEPSALQYISGGPLLFLALLIVVVRPLAVVLSSFGMHLSWKEQAFLSWMAPRGIVAAAVASLFSFRLAEHFPGDAAGMVPVVFLVIVGTVTVYGLTISPIARWLGLAQPDPQGAIFIGAHEWARKLGLTVKDAGFKVLMVDVNPKNVRAARQAGLPSIRANVLSESIMDDLDLSGIGRLIAITLNDEVNSLAALHFSDVFESSEVFQLPTRSESGRESEIPLRLRGKSLFAPDATYSMLDERFKNGATIETIEITEKTTFSKIRTEYDDALPLFLIRGEKLHVFSAAQNELSPSPGDKLIALFDVLPILEESGDQQEDEDEE